MSQSYGSGSRKKHVPPSNEDQQKLITAIRTQTEGIQPHFVYVLDIVSVRFGGYFTQVITQQLQKFRFLQMLTLNDCNIVSLANFPQLPSLIRLDMVFNQIPGSDLEYLTGCKHIQTLMLGANRIETLEDLIPLKKMRSLLQLDLLNNDVTKVPGYRATVYENFSSLTILDTLDKIGKDAYTNSTMMEAVSRIPGNLFDKNPLPSTTNVFIHQQANKKLKRALSRVGSLDIVLPKIHKSKHKASIIVPISSRNLGTGLSRKAGICFPINRIRRKLKQIMIGHRVSLNGAIYMTAVLQYLAAQIIELSGYAAKKNRKKRISPQEIKDALKDDEVLHKWLDNVTVGMYA